MRRPHTDEQIAAFVFIFGSPWILFTAITMVELLNR